MIYFDSEKEYFYSTLISHKNIVAGFTTKKQGNMLIEDRLNEFLQSVTPFKTLIWSKQKHSTNINTVVGATIEGIMMVEEGDGQITSLPETVLNVRTADCVPIIYADKTAGIIGVSHQGWRGTFDGMAPKMISEMIRQGATIENIVVAIGPCISNCCYELYGDRLTQFKERYARYKGDIFREEKGKTFLNLLALNYNQLREAGLRKEHIDTFPFCTSCNEEKFWSYRRDQKILGEMAAFIIKTI